MKKLLLFLTAVVLCTTDLFSYSIGVNTSPTQIQIYQKSAGSSLFDVRVYATYNNGTQSCYILRLSSGVTMTSSTRIAGSHDFQIEDQTGNDYFLYNVSNASYIEPGGYAYSYRYCGGYCYWGYLTGTLSFTWKSVNESGKPVYTIALSNGAGVYDENMYESFDWSMNLPLYAYDYNGDPMTLTDYYQVSASANDDSMGTVSGGGFFANGATTTLSATQTAGVFVEWQKNGLHFSDDKEVEVQIDNNATYTAIFTATNNGTITVKAGANGQVKLDNGSWGATSSDDYNGGDNAMITAQANEGYLFYQWLDNAGHTQSNNPYTVKVSGDNTYTASFKRAYTITTGVNDEAFGSVGITEPYSGGKYYEGQSITLTASPANSFTSFAKWQKNGEDIAGGASLNVTVNANDTYTAFFSGRNIIEVDIPNATYVDRNATYSLRGNSNGTSSESSGYYVDVQFNASTDALYSVDGIKHNGSNMSFTTKTIEGLEQPCGNRVITHLLCYNATGDVYRFNIHFGYEYSNDENATFSHNFTEVQDFTYIDEWQGIHLYAGKEYTCSNCISNCGCAEEIDLLFITGLRCSDDVILPEGTYPINCTGEPQTVLANIWNDDKHFSYAWDKSQNIDGGSRFITDGYVTVQRNGNSYNISVNAKNSYGANITSTITFNASSVNIPTYTLNVTTDGHGTAKVYRYDCNDNENLVSNSGSYKQGSYFKLEATQSSGYTFDYWTIDGVDEHFTNNPLIFDGLYDNATITAHFKTVSTDLVLKDGVTDGQTDIDFDAFKATYNGQTMSSVTLNRTFTAGNWATICLPFYVDESQLTNAGLFRKVYEFRYATGSADVGDQVTFHFRVATSMEAGRGYLVKGTSGMGSSFVFNNVTINTSADTEADVNDLKGVNAYYDQSVGSSEIVIVGVLRSGTLRAEGKKVMGLAQNKIWYPHTNGNPMPAYRAYFYNPNASASVMPRVRIVVEGEGETELEVVDGELYDAGGEDRAPRKYIRNGVLIIERNGVRYDAQGKRL